MKKCENIISVLAILIWFALIYFITKNNIFLYISFLILLLAIISRKFSILIIRFWTKFGIFLGYINSKIILFIIFYLFVTPYSIILRIFNKKISILIKNKFTSFITKEYTYSAKDFKNMW